MWVILPNQVRQMYITAHQDIRKSAVIHRHIDRQIDKIPSFSTTDLICFPPHLLCNFHSSPTI